MTRLHIITTIRVAIFIAACLGVFTLAFRIISNVALDLERQNAPVHAMNRAHAEILSAASDAGGMRVSRSLRHSSLSHTSLYYIPTEETTNFKDRVDE